jgi:hypothetical protein
MRLPQKPEKKLLCPVETIPDNWAVVSAVAKQAVKKLAFLKGTA